MKLIQALWILLFAVVANAAPLEFGEGTTPFLKAQVGQVLGLLPASYLDASKGIISFRVKDISDAEMSDDLCQMGKGAIFGTTKRKRTDHSISISKKLLELAQTNIKNFSCSHGNFQKLLQATILHELTHVKDNFEHLSSDADFQRIVGVKALHKSSKKKIMNQDTNLEESLAVNVEYLILDPEFECRRPATANFLSKRLGFTLKGQCQKNDKVLTQSAYLEDHYQQAISINPERVYQIHYLFAGKGQALMSRWGHAMFRLVICAPHRQKVGPECLGDVSHHLALSYRANVDDLNLNYSKGIRGAYPSQLYIFRFLEIQQEYTKFELRDLYSIPLKLTKEQKKEFIDVTLERFWSYQGKYYFVDNNCGTEAKKHLAIALEDDQSRLIRSVTPKQIYRDVIDANVSKLTRSQMIERKLLIPSLYADLEKRYLELRQLGVYREKTLTEFLKHTSGQERLEIYQRIFRSEMYQQNKDLIIKIIFIERYMATRLMLEFPKRVFTKMRKDKEMKSEVMKMSGALRSFFIQPWQVVSGAYGVPTQAEMEKLFPEYMLQRKSAIQGPLQIQLKNLDVLLRKAAFTDDLNEIEIMQKIKTFTNSILGNMLEDL